MGSSFAPPQAQASQGSKLDCQPGRERNASPKVHVKSHSGLHKSFICKSRLVAMIFVCARRRASEDFRPWGLTSCRARFMASSEAPPVVAKDVLPKTAGPAAPKDCRTRFAAGSEVLLAVAPLSLRPPSPPSKSQLSGRQSLPTAPALKLPRRGQRQPSSRKVSRRSAR